MAVTILSTTEMKGIQANEEIFVCMFLKILSAEYCKISIFFCYTKFMSERVFCMPFLWHWASHMTSSDLSFFIYKGYVMDPINVSPNWLLDQGENNIQGFCFLSFHSLANGLDLAYLFLSYTVTNTWYRPRKHYAFIYCWDMGILVKKITFSFFEVEELKCTHAYIQ